MRFAEDDWYTCDIEPRALKKLMRRTDRHGSIFMVGHFALIAATGYMAILSLGTPWAIPAFLLYGTIFAFSEAAAHELSHNTVFRTQWMNDVAVMVIGFMAWREPVYGRQRHFRHHSYTSIRGDDPEGEAVRPKSLVVMFLDMLTRFGHGRIHLGAIWRHAFGILTPQDEELVPESFRPEMIRNSRILLTAYAGVFAWSAATASWLPILFLFLPRVYGTWLHDLCSKTQHTGLALDVPDHRLTSRTVKLGPVLRFLYWNMNYHIEHHLYPSVPFHALPKLRAALDDQLPEASDGLIGAWREMVPTLWKQRTDPDHYFEPVLPADPTTT